MIAYVIGLMLLLFFFLLTQVSPTLPVGMQNAITLLNPINHYQLMLRGVVSLEDVMLFVLVTVSFISMSWFELERRGWR